jgi:hypothetical protein
MDEIAETIEKIVREEKFEKVDENPDSLEAISPYFGPFIHRRSRSFLANKRASRIHRVEYQHPNGIAIVVRNVMKKSWYFWEEFFLGGVEMSRRKEVVHIMYAPSIEEVVLFSASERSKMKYDDIFMRAPSLEAALYGVYDEMKSCLMYRFPIAQKRLKMEG